MEDKALEKAKMQLMRIPDSVFYSTILFSLKQSWSVDTETAGVDGTNLVINPIWFIDLTEEERIGLLVHEVLHVALNHMTRKGDRHHKVFNAAGDHVINLAILDSGSYTLPANGLWDSRFTGMNTEQVYDILWDEAEQDKANGGAGADGIGIPGGSDIVYPENSVEVEIVEKEVADIVQRATIVAQASNSTPGILSGEIAVQLDEIVNPELPWEVIFQNYMTSFVKENYSWKKVNKRYLPQFYLPTAFSETVGEIAIAVDASCSVSDKEFSHFIGAISCIQETVKPEKITLLTFDTKIREIQEITQDTDIMSELSFTGRGGTRIHDLMEWAKDNKPMVLLVFTDGEFTVVPDPGCPVVWLIHNSTYFIAPYGEIINYNI